MVGYLWWHQVNNETAGGFFNMMKKTSTPPTTWYQELSNKGLEYQRGLQPKQFLVGGGGNNAADCQVGTYSGDCILAGVQHNLPSRESTDIIYKIRRNGGDSGGFYGSEDSDTAGLVANTGTGRAGYCDIVGSSWSFTECTDGYFLWAHLLAATGDNYDEGKVIAYMGLDEYPNKRDAEAQLQWELETLRIFPDNADAGMQSLMRPLYSFLVQTKDTSLSRPTPACLLTTACPAPRPTPTTIGTPRTSPPRTPQRPTT
jgi:hypothetical protein